MKLLGMFRKKSVPRQLEVAAGSLGEARWSNDEDRWCGRANGVEYFLSPCGDAPDVEPALLSCAESMLSSGRVFELVREAIETYATQNLEHSEEVRSLSLQSVDFYLRKGSFHMNCQLGYGAPDRFWAIEFRNGEFTGMGFDT